MHYALLIRQFKYTCSVECTWALTSRGANKVLTHVHARGAQQLVALVPRPAAPSGVRRAHGTPRGEPEGHQQPEARRVGGRCLEHAAPPRHVDHLLRAKAEGGDGERAERYVDGAVESERSQQRPRRRRQAALGAEQPRGRRERVPHLPREADERVAGVEQLRERPEERGGAELREAAAVVLADAAAEQPAVVVVPVDARAALAAVRRVRRLRRLALGAPRLARLARLALGALGAMWLAADAGAPPRAARQGGRALV